MLENGETIPKHRSVGFQMDQSLSEPITVQVTQDGRGSEDCKTLEG